MKNVARVTVIAVLVFGFMAAVAVNAKTVDEEKEYNKYLMSKIKDENLGIRASAMQLLGERKCCDATKSLVWILENDKEYAARITAALALHKIGDEKLIPVLKKRAKNDRNKTVRHVLIGIVRDMETTYLATK